MEPNKPKFRFRLNLFDSIVLVLALIQDHEDKAFVLAGIEGYEDALVTVEAPYTEGEDSLLLGGGFKLRVGVTAYVRGSGYMGSGPVVSIERGEQG